MSGPQPVLAGGSSVSVISERSTENHSELNFFQRSKQYKERACVRLYERMRVSAGVTALPSETP